MKKIFLIALLGSLFTFGNVFAGLNYQVTGASGSQTFINQWLSNLIQTNENLFGGMSDAFAASNAVFPVFGEPYRNFAIGAQGALSFVTPKESNNSSGGGGLGDLGIGAAAAPFVTISTHPLGGFFEDSDITFKLLPLSISTTDVDFKFFNAGVIFRQQIIQKMRLIPILFSFEGISWSAGLLYNSSEITFKNFDINASVNENFGGVPVTGTLSKANGTVKIKTFTLDGEAKAYFNLLYLLDIFGGAGISLNLVNKFELDTYFDTNVTEGANSINGKVRIYGEDSGKFILPRIMAGTQINLGPVKIPFQFTYIFTTAKAYSFTLGATISF